MKRMLPILILFFYSGKANDSYLRTQTKIKTVQTKIYQVNKKIEAITVQIDSLGFTKTKIESL